jgi:hypothetical protein
MDAFPRVRIKGWRNSMQYVRPIAGRVLRFVFNRWLKEAAKVHYL